MDPRVQRRLDGYVSAMKDAGLFEQRFVVTTATPTSVTLGGALFTDLLAREPDLDAVFCANDDLALGVLFECRRREIGVPEQIGIVGFNDLEFMASAVPTLTSVRTNRYEMGKTAATMLIEAIEGRRPEQPVLDLGFRVIERQSSSSRHPDNRPALSGGAAPNKMVALPSSHD
ncbi:DNA-binding LacI/PurR family transcriptional regulator [Bradyrhizobium huanghuaihaiense]